MDLARIGLKAPEAAAEDPEAVLSQYTLGKQKQQNCPIISTTTQPDKSIQKPGNLKQKIITGTTNHTNHNKTETKTSKNQTETIVKANKTSLVKIICTHLEKHHYMYMK